MENSLKSKTIKVFSSVILILACAQPIRSQEKTMGKDMKRIFLNASKNKNGTTADHAHRVLKGLDYKTVNLVDYHIDQIGQESKQDEFKKVIEQLARPKLIVIGTPVYWSDMTGYLKTFIDRLSDISDGPLDSDTAPLKGADVYLIVQGTEPSDAIPGITTVIKHICRKFFMNYKGIILDIGEANAINKKLLEGA